jgi:hypothetical protein
MLSEIEKAIKIILTQKITEDVKADDALKFTQAVLNLAHAKVIVMDMDK